MAKATKKSPNRTPDVEPSTSTARPKRGRTFHQLQIITRGKKNRQCCCTCTRKVQKTTKKTKKALASISKRRSSKKTSPKKKTKKAERKQLFGHYRRLMEELTSGSETEPEPSCTESSSESDDQ